MDAVLRFSFMSDRLREVTGVDPCSTLGKTRQEIGAGDTDAEKWETHLADLSAHRPFREFRYIYVAASGDRSEEHTSELQSLMRISYAVFCLNKKTSTQKPISSQYHMSYVTK